MWVEDIINYERSTRVYVTRVAEMHKKFMKDNMKLIKTYKYPELSQLEQNIRTDEKLATDQRDSMDRVSNLIRNAMTEHKMKVLQTNTLVLNILLLIN